MIHRKEVEIGGRTLSIEMGKLSRAFGAGGGKSG